MICQECNHEKGECRCLCCCYMSEVGCPWCVLPVLGYRQFKKMIRAYKSGR